MSILLVGMMLVIALALIVVMAVTSVLLGQRKLQSHADHAALAAADSFRELSAAEGQEVPDALLDGPMVRASAAEHLQRVGAEHDLDALSLDAATTSDGRTARVRLSARAHPPIVTWVLPAGVTVVAEGEARAELVP